MKLTEELMNKMNDINDSMTQIKSHLPLKSDSQTVFHILTGMADTFVLVLESISLGKIIDEEKEQLRIQMCKAISKLSQGSDTPPVGNSKNQTQKVAARLVRTASSNYRIHSKKVPNQSKMRKMFLENATPYKYVNDESKDALSVSDMMSTALISSTVLYKGDAFEISSLASFKNKLIHTLDTTNFPWRDLVKRSIKAIEAFRKKQPKSESKNAINIGGMTLFSFKSHTFLNRNPIWSNRDNSVTTRD
jgi:hypothetical protein